MNTEVNVEGVILGVRDARARLVLPTPLVPTVAMSGVVFIFRLKNRTAYFVGVGSDIASPT
jgi:hypothetical protein